MSEFTEHLKDLSARTNLWRTEFLRAAESIESMEAVLEKIGTHLGVESGDVEGLLAAIGRLSKVLDQAILDHENDYDGDTHDYAQMLKDLVSGRQK